MKTFIKLVALTVALTSGIPAMAQNPTQIFSGCLVDALNGKERKNLAKWIFLAMSSHPEMKIYSSASAKDLKENDEYVGKLITRLLVEDCPDEFKKAYAADVGAIEQAFRLVGEVAMQELMTNQETSQALINYTKYADLERINAIIGGK
jgi:hypothetical protein